MSTTAASGAGAREGGGEASSAVPPHGTDAARVRTLGCRGSPGSWASLLCLREVGGSRSGPRWLQLRHLGGDAAVRRLALRHKLKEHRGCVNTVEFNETGSLIASGSDDKIVNIWTGHDCTPRLLGGVQTGHSHNLFCAKFVPGTQSTKIVTAAGDGQIRLSDVERHSTDRVKKPAPWMGRAWWEDDTRGTTSGDHDCECLCGAPTEDSPLVLDSRGEMTLKITFVPDSPLTFLATGRDQKVVLYDLRESVGMKKLLIDMSDKGPTTDCVFDPNRPHVFALGCEDPFVRLYDIRRGGKSAKTSSAVLVATFAPEQVLQPAEQEVWGGRSGDKFRTEGASGLDWSAQGEIAVTYRSADAYTFDATDLLPRREGHAVETDRRFIARLVGHANSDTFLKECKFVAGGEYVATGSDCGRLFVYQKRSGRLVRMLRADSSVVNGLSCHPHLPRVVTCGIDSDVKVFDLGEDLEPALTEAEIAAVRGKREKRTSRGWMHQGETVTTMAECEAKVASVTSLRIRGNEHFKAGKWEEASSVYQECIAALNIHAPTSRSAAQVGELLSTCRLNQAACKLKAKKWDEARKLCEEVLKVQEGNDKALYRRAQALIELQEFDSAKEDIDSLLAKSSQDAGFRRLLDDWHKKKDASKAKEMKAFARMFKK